MARIALAGGGTGGHVYPALAIGDALRARGHDVLYYGDPDRLEGRVAPSRGYTFRPVKSAQFPRGGVVGKLRFALSLLRATLSARARLRADGVDAVLGVGGYIAAPTVLAAWTLGLGRAIHEANVVPGLANKLCARVAQAVLLTFEATGPRLPGHAPRHVVGVPVNPAILGAERAEGAARYGLDPALPTVLVVGGSLGAARLNELAVALARSARAQGAQVLHLCGPRYETDLRAAWAEAGGLPGGYALVGYEDRMGMAYAAADLVVARAGSATLAELTAVGKPSVLVPSPNVTENHQEENARGLERAGAAEVVVEAGFDVDAVAARVFALLADAETRGRMGSASGGLARLDAAAMAADVVEGLLGPG